jgi:periplasmic divalent cation tolerance protein
MRPSSFLLVLSTASSRREALKLSNLILSARLAACVNISSTIESHYWWKGKRTRGKEVMLFIKTKAAAYKKLEALLLKHHSYSVPEIIALPLANGSKSYLRWIAREVPKP